jgi:transposase
MMDTMTTDKKRVRRNHSEALKAQVLAECEVPGTSVATVAMSHGINANIVHGWRKLAREHAASPGAATAFVPLAIEAASPPERRIDVELRRGAVSMTMSWPLSASAEMTACMRELLR